MIKGDKIIMSNNYVGNDPVNVSNNDKSLAALAHASSLIALILSAGWLSFVGPLIMWFIYKDKNPFVQQAAAGSFNFNLGLWVMSIVAWILVITIIGIPIAIILWIISFVGQFVWHIIATVKAMNGVEYNYPFQIKVLK